MLLRGHQVAGRGFSIVMVVCSLSLPADVITLI